MWRSPPVASAQSPLRDLMNIFHTDWPMQATSKIHSFHPIPTTSTYYFADLLFRFWVGLLLFAMDLAVSDQEIDLCKQLGKPAWAAVCLTNDIYSWEKERDDAAKSGDSHVINAIWVLMTEHSISEPQAQELCRQKIKEHVVEARHVAEESKRNPELSPALKAYTEAMLYTISGNLVWSTYCPRYHPERT